MLIIPALAGDNDINLAEFETAFDNAVYDDRSGLATAESDDEYGQDQRVIRQGDPGDLCIR